ncbi:regulator of G-protein signaling 17-like [Labeo rohita]|uniref:regulator of G-protein signaling 17-like n=1 Tax=Labeo rohita TaxID=84645 RepID=UPI0021E26556|nr:regulator of G-protein signaling 17-like [Labeo rohita]
MWKRKQRRVGNSQESGQPKPSTSFIWCEHGGCCTRLWNADKKLISGSQHFEVILRCPVARDVFKEFLQSEYSEENLMFWIACEDLKNETDPSTIAEKARKIYEDYISVSSLKEINLDSQIRNDISQSLEEPSSMMYEEAQHQIYNLMRRDSFPPGREVFLEFLRSECSENNLMFWIACEELKTETNPSTTAAKARTIYHEYLARFSQNKVSLDTQVHDRILQNLKEPSSTIYDEAQLQIYDLMRRDSFPGFLKSSVYINFLSKKSKFLDTHVNKSDFFSSDLRHKLEF